MSEKLKPCPFCGSSHVLAEDFEELDMGIYWIRCRDCGAGVSKKDTMEEAIKAWNRRIIRDVQRDDQVPPAEPKRGKWKPIDVYEVVVACSECKQKFTYEHNFCPNCGTKMEVTE